MTDPRAEYVTDVAYLRNFVDDLAPVRLRLACALNGFAPPKGEGYRYCELGSGNGDTLATLAAANPTSTFVGLDINAEHVAFAEKLAANGELGNVRFLERDFAECVDDEELGRFHFMGAHGVLSWISPEKRAALIDFASKRLEPGGLLTVSYNAMPGWAAIEPLRRLMLDTSNAIVGNTAARAKAGLDAARMIAEAGADYFVQNPTARSMLDAMHKGGFSYISHEYFHTYWSPMYFTDVAAPMAAAGLFYVGQLPLYLNYKDLAIPPSLGPLFAGITDRIVLERMKDYAVNEFFRRDVYVKGNAPCTVRNAHAYLDSTSVGVPAGRIQREIKLPHTKLSLTGAVFDVLVPELIERPGTPPEVASRPSLARFSLTQIREAIRSLLLSDQATPLAAVERPIVTSTDEKLDVQLPYNRASLAQRLSSSAPVVLASLASQTGLALTTLHAACLHVLIDVPLAERGAWIASFVREGRVKLFDRDQPITDVAEQERIFAQELERFEAHRVPELRALGIVV